jgi:hypothetical protein
VLVHCADVGDIADVSEVHAASIFRVEGTEDIRSTSIIGHRDSLKSVKRAICNILQSLHVNLSYPKLPYGCNAVKSGRNLPTFRSHILFPYSWSKSRASKQEQSVLLTLRTCIWSHYVLPKRQ